MIEDDSDLVENIVNYYLKLLNEIKGVFSKSEGTPQEIMLNEIRLKGVELREYFGAETFSPGIFKIFDETQLKIPTTILDDISEHVDIDFFKNYIIPSIIIIRYCVELFGNLCIYKENDGEFSNEQKLKLLILLKLTPIFNTYILIPVNNYLELIMKDLEKVSSTSPKPISGGAEPAAESNTDLEEIYNLHREIEDLKNDLDINIDEI